MIESTVSGNKKRAIQAAKEYKLTKHNYTSLVSDLISANYDADLDAIEIGSSGNYERRTVTIIKGTVPHVSKSQIIKFLLHLSSIAIFHF